MTNPPDDGATARPSTLTMGAVLAGGLSSRFGSNKAHAILDGCRLIDHATAALATQCATVVLVGRADGSVSCVPDWPGPHMGPLGGIAGALFHAQQAKYHQVLTCGVDSPYLPLDLADMLGPAPAFLRAQPVIGLWPTAALSMLQEILTQTTNHSVRHFADRIGARAVDPLNAPFNINSPADLDRIAHSR